MNRFSPKTSFLAILLLAVSLRLLGIVSRPIWYDEALSLLYGRTSPWDITFAMLGSGKQAANVHPPTYFIGLWGWMNLFGDSVVIARLFSVMFGLLTIGAVYFLVKELFSDIELANYAAFFIAISPFHIHYSQEIRMYACMAFFLVLSTLFFLKAFKTSKNIYFLFFSVSAALAQYLQSLAGFYLLSLAISALLTNQPRFTKKIFVAGIGALVLYLPWLLQLPAQLSKVQTAYWVEQPGFAKFFTLLLVYVANVPLPSEFLPAVFFVAMLAIILAFYQTIKALRDPKKSMSELFCGVWLAYLGIFPALLMFLVSLRFPVFLERALLASGLMFLLWLVWAFYKTHMPVILRQGMVALLFMAFSVGIYQHITYTGFPYAPYENMANMLKQELDAKSTIVHSSKLSLIPLHYYNSDISQVFVADPIDSPIDTLANETRKVIGVISVKDLATATQGMDTVFLVIFQRSRDEASLAGLYEHPHIIWMDEYFHRDGEQVFDDILIYRYLRRSMP